MSDRIVATSYGGDVVVFRHARSPKLHCRVRKPDGTGWHYTTTGKIEVDQARSFAESLYAEMKLRQRVGLSSAPATFRQAAEAHIRAMKAAVAMGDMSPRALKDYVPVIERYFLPYFTDKPIEAITPKDIGEYREWRKSYWITGPGAANPSVTYTRNGKTIQRPVKAKAPSRSKLSKEEVCLRAIFATAVAKGLVKSYAAPDVKAERVSARTKNRRTMKPAIEPEQLRRLLQFMETWVDEGDNKARRILLRDVIVFLCDTGVRPGTESDGIQWKHVRNRKTKGGNYRKEILVSGKTGSRAVVVGMEGGNAIGRIQGRRVAFLREQNNVRGWPPPKVDPDEYVIGLPDGTPIKNDYLRSLFYKLLRAAGMLTDALGQKRSIYCCRHTFARNQLNAGVNVYWLKDQMGTSVSMLEKFYGDTRAFAGADNLVGLRGLI